ncbi:MAG: hypothetical protein ABI479_01815 [Gallionella sp.]
MIKRLAAHLMPKLMRHHVTKALVVVGLALTPAISVAETPGFFSVIESKPVGELWLNPGFYSYHFEKDKGLENRNFGLGGEYRYSTVSSITLGVFDNSDRQTSHYAGWYWQPLGLGQVRLGAVVGAIDGYPNMLNGGWFFAVIPTASIEYDKLGVNMLFVPGYKDRLYGAISLQLKFRLY